ncbi:peptidoglycan editing factor PgeF [Martelella endophytica]|uniref:Purine nucleoside phosphorylase n=1 Tax=Martelella endophytica TaxID=1486262 RepID=A0A0D5LVR3_MAREN|nr:peptidoglycan editing factor PgeF [Martelella endophytica]AJY48111.1 polyphenol oxidase [Martelella endophytica]
MAESGAIAPMTSVFMTERLAPAGIRHGFFTRRGGVSTGIYESLNCGAGSADRPEDVAENRARVARWFGHGAERLASLHQCHSAEAIRIDAPFAGKRPEADGMVTRTPGLVLGILTADCGPVLFADPKNGVIGAAHAGWRGAFSGILEATAEAMIAVGAERQSIVACLGPTISRRAYEVGPEFVDRFVETDQAFARFFTPSSADGHAMFDLPAFIGLRLERAGIAHDIIDHCTYEDEDGLFSYRRTTHHGEKDYGRQLSAIAL